MRLYSLALALVCSCFFSFFIFRIPIAVLRPYMSSFFFLFTLCLYTLELTLAYVWWDGVVSFLYSFYPHALSYICIYVMVKSRCLKHIKRRTSTLNQDATWTVAMYSQYLTPPVNINTSAKSTSPIFSNMNTTVSSTKTTQSPRTNSSSSHISTNNPSWTTLPTPMTGNSTIPTTPISHQWKLFLVKMTTEADEEAHGVLKQVDNHQTHPHGQPTTGPPLVRESHKRRPVLESKCRTPHTHPCTSRQAVQINGRQ